jgi:hypothetical protein
MSELEWLTNTDDKNWRRWCGRPGARMGAAKGTDAYTATEIARMGFFGLYAPPREQSATEPATPSENIWKECR